MADKTCRILVMASGNGSNFQALVDGIAAGSITNARITRLIVNRGKAFATQRADKAGIPWEYFNMVTHGFQAKGEKDAAALQAGREAYDAALAQKILDAQRDDERPQLIVLAGWMHVFTKAFLDPIDAAGIKVINLHPALPGKYDGAGAIQRAYDDFQAGTLENNTTGIMVHFVIDVVDRGAPILTREIVVQPGETLADLETRIHAEEHALIVAATQKVVQEVVQAEERSSL
ncbi:phosphoribosylglycinamide formyltransferase [Sporothrix brasiliensis 5110]|uniref:Phosphoribosylglycinamide formyltransferase n=1 Tax=Sporothrix brasiliensis 5110 TaxID=1398154 RepID=A0A0C2J4D6_9PEZI|nr:phosphoribosylglycinamide formyltransferase [Sporothrix brasiliensis 5110]KIH91952.1 phosphoribosylglycinamide formyltransferase [Sporothrix brasiliensis 5110]